MSPTFRAPYHRCRRRAPADDPRARATGAARGARARRARTGGTRGSPRGMRASSARTCSASTCASAASGRGRVEAPRSARRARPIRTAAARPTAGGRARRRRSRRAGSRGRGAGPARRSRSGSSCRKPRWRTVSRTSVADPSRSCDRTAIRRAAASSTGLPAHARRDGMPTADALRHGARAPPTASPRSSRGPSRARSPAAACRVPHRAHRRARPTRGRRPPGGTPGRRARRLARSDLRSARPTIRSPRAAGARSTRSAARGGLVDLDQVVEAEHAARERPVPEQVVERGEEHCRGRRRPVELGALRDEHRRPAVVDVPARDRRRRRRAPRRRPRIRAAPPLSRQCSTIPLSVSAPRARTARTTSSRSRSASGGVGASRIPRWSTRSGRS